MGHEVRNDRDLLMAAVSAELASPSKVATIVRGTAPGAPARVYRSSQYLYHR